MEMLQMFTYDAFIVLIQKSYWSTYWKAWCTRLIVILTKHPFLIYWIELVTWWPNTCVNTDIGGQYIYRSTHLFVSRLPAPVCVVLALLTECASATSWYNSVIVLIITKWAYCILVIFFIYSQWFSIGSCVNYMASWPCLI